MCVWDVAWIKRRCCWHCARNVGDAHDPPTVVTQARVAAFGPPPRNPAHRDGRYRRSRYGPIVKLQGLVRSDGFSIGKINGRPGLISVGLLCWAGIVGSTARPGETDRRATPIELGSERGSSVVTHVIEYATYRLDAATIAMRTVRADTKCQLHWLHRGVSDYLRYPGFRPGGLREFRAYPPNAM